LAQDQQAVQGALMHDMEAGLVAVQEMECGAGGEVAESGGQAGEIAAGGLGLHGSFEHLGFHGPGAAETPGGGGHFFDEAELDVIDGSPLGDGDVEEFFECGGRFGADENLASEETVAAGVAGGMGLAGGGFGSGGESGVGAVGAET